MPIPEPATTVTNETTYGISPYVGIGTKYARDDHTHGSPSMPSIPQSATTVIPEQTYGQSPSVGTLATYAREDHAHGTPNIYIPGPLTNQVSNRALNTVYTNNTGRPILLMVIGGCNGNANPSPFAVLYVTSDTNNPPTTVVAGGVGLQPGISSINEIFWFQLVAFIDIGLNYSVNTITSGGGTVILSSTGWYELQL